MPDDGVVAAQCSLFFSQLRRPLQLPNPCVRFFFPNSPPFFLFSLFFSSFYLSPFFYTRFWGSLPFFISGTGGLPHRPRPKAPGPSVCFDGWGFLPFFIWELGVFPERPPAQSPRTQWFTVNGASAIFHFGNRKSPPEGFRPKAPEPMVVLVGESGVGLG